MNDTDNIRNYTTYVSEQTARAALAKGAPLMEYKPEYEGRYFKSDDVNFYMHPSAEQLCNWMEKNYKILPTAVLCYLERRTCWSGMLLDVTRNGVERFDAQNEKLMENDFDDRESALFDAIDAALEVI